MNPRDASQRPWFISAFFENFYLTQKISILATKNYLDKAEKML